MALLILSPHSDDAVLSLGASIHRWTSAGLTVRVLTVFGGAPTSSEPASAWDSRRSLATAGEVSVARRAEDVAALAVLRAGSEWIDLLDEQYARATPIRVPELASMLAERVESDDVLLAPAFPLLHRDHQATHDAAMLLAGGGRSVIGYQELPYARLVGCRRQRTKMVWRRVSSSRADQRAKREAVAQYRQEIKSFGPSAALVTRVSSIVNLERVALAEGRWPPELTDTLR